RRESKEIAAKRRSGSPPRRRPPQRAAISAARRSIEGWVADCREGVEHAEWRRHVLHLTARRRSGFVAGQDLPIMPRSIPTTLQTRTFVRVVALVIALAGCGIAFRTTMTSLAWIDRVFPGFMLLDNRVV